MSQSVITLDQLKHVAKISRLDLTEDQLEKFLPQVESVLEYFDVLNQTDTANIEPTYQVTGQKNILREDVVDTNRMFTQAQALANAPEQSNGYFVTKAVIKK